MLTSGPLRFARTPTNTRSKSESAEGKDMTSPLPGDVDTRFDRSVEAAMKRLEAESHDQRLFEREPFDDSNIWLLDVLPGRLRILSQLPRKIWEGGQALEDFYDDNDPWLTRAVAYSIITFMVVAVVVTALI